MIQMLSIFFCLGLLSGCHPSGPTDANAIIAEETVDTAVNIEGVWRVGRIDGEALTQAYSIIFYIDESAITATSQCVRFRWRYQISGDRLAISVEALAEPACSRALTEDEQRLAALLPQMVRAQRGPDGRLSMSGSDMVITFLHQDTP